MKIFIMYPSHLIYFPSDSRILYMYRLLNDNEQHIELNFLTFWLLALLEQQQMGKTTNPSAMIFWSVYFLIIELKFNFVSKTKQQWSKKFFQSSCRFLLSGDTTIAIADAGVRVIFRWKCISKMFRDFSGFCRTNRLTFAAPSTPHQHIFMPFVHFVTLIHILLPLLTAISWPQKQNSISQLITLKFWLFNLI